MASLFSSQEVKECLSGYPLFKSNDEVEEIRTNVGQVYKPHAMNVVGKGQRLSADMDYLALKDVSFSYLTYNADISVRSDPLEKFILVMVPLNGLAHFKCGTSEIIATSNLGAIVNPTTELNMRWENNCEQFIIKINREAIERTCSAYLGRDVAQPVEFSLGLNLESGGSLDRMLALILSNQGLANKAAKSPLLTANLEQLLISTLLLSQQHQYFAELLSPAQIVTPHFVKKAEEFMHEHAASPLTMKDVAEHVGVSLRSLYAGFETYRKSSPKAFLKNRRLELVRANLLESKYQGKQTTITETALAWGFSHLGYFTKDYRKKFGELPSETLKK